MSKGLTSAGKRRIATAAAAATVSLVLVSPAAAQKCNPVIDGTYCEEQMRQSTASSRSQIQMRPIQDIGSAMSVSPGLDSPGTLGGISFRSGGSTCIGLLRRGACN